MLSSFKIFTPKKKVENLQIKCLCIGTEPHLESEDLAILGIYKNHLISFELSSTTGVQFSFFIKQKHAIDCARHWKHGIREPGINL